MSSLRKLISERIRASGPVSFAEFMELSLYHPEFGYYARTAQRTGRAGDFFTSVDVGDVFGELLAKQFSEMSRLLSGSSQLEAGNSQLEAGSSELEAGSSKLEAFDLVEAGSGNGRLSKDILDAILRSDPELYGSIRLSLVERSAAARQAQAANLGPHAALLKYSGAALPDHIRGVIFANELLDALPTHAVVMTETGLREVFVDERNGQFVEHLQDPSTPRIA
jgi:X-X-X-Leu-X-X-Gly heptad repeat protein